jgi:hypothetical protein
MHRQAGFTSFTLLAELNEPGAMYAYAVTQTLQKNVTLIPGWPPVAQASDP